MNSSYLTATGIAVVAAAWILSGQLAGLQGTANADGPVKATAKREMLRSVRVRTIEAQTFRREIFIRGRTEASRSVKLRAETSGRIGAVLIHEGKRVQTGQALAQIDLEERRAALAEAEALLRQRSIEYNAARSLAAKGYRSGTKLAEAVAQLDAARARVSRIRTDIARTTVRAPFEGILERRFIELGDYVRVGDDICRIVDLDPILVVGAVSEREVGSLKTGIGANVSLVDGRNLEGRVRYVAAVADPATRTFRVEVEIPNAAGLIRDGISSEVRLSAAAKRAHFISSSLLSLDESGRLGIKAVENGDRVVFHPVEILADRPGGIWVEGLPDSVELITVGQEYVRAGQRVKLVRETAESAS